MRIISILTVWLFAVASAFAQDEPLPESVATPYLAYEAAVEAGDAQAAAQAAEQAWRAAREFPIETEIRAVLAENAGVASRRAENWQTAISAFLEAAELHQVIAANSLFVAGNLRMASEAQLRLDDHTNAFTTAEEAIGILLSLEPTERVYQEMALSYVTMSSSLWLRQRYRDAGPYSENAVRAAQYAGISDAYMFGVAAFRAGTGYAIEDKAVEAAYWFTVANALMGNEGASQNLKDAVAAWNDVMRAQLDSGEQSALVERLHTEGFYIDAFEEAAVHAAFISTPGQVRVDAEPLERRSPDYPPASLRAGFQGFTLIRFDVNPLGQVVNEEVVYSIPVRDFGEEGLRTVQHWRYQPATINGEPTFRRGMVTRLDFTLSTGR